jgi:hypothetical protein
VHVSDRPAVGIVIRGNLLRIAVLVVLVAGTALLAGGASAPQRPSVEAGRVGAEAVAAADSADRWR